MRYTFIGDCHGKTQELVSKLKLVDYSQKVIQLGDMGLGFRDIVLPELHKDFGFIRGNHDSPDHCRMHPNYIGDFGMWNGVFCVGGAFSIDWLYRVPGKSWWFDEQISDEQLEQCLKLYCNVKPQIVASHDAPQSIGEMLLR